MNGATDFRAAIEAAGLQPPPQIEPGRFHRFPGLGKRDGNTAGWCKLFEDGRGGVFGDFSANYEETWQERQPQFLTPAEREAIRRHQEAAKTEAAAKRSTEQREAAQEAQRIWGAAKPAPESHRYLKRKGVKSHGLRIDDDGRLIVPVRQSGELISLQFISEDGEKRFLPGGRVTGGYCSIGSKVEGAICIAEGYATAATIHAATGHPVAVAFNCGNFEAVARSLREKFPRARLVLCADDDARTDGNPGLSKATDAARAVAGLLAVPDFGADRPEKATDFNDLAEHRGADAVRRCIASAEELGRKVWNEPLPLIAETAAEAYPVDALPGAIGDAVREVAAFVQCPIALAACSALSALSTTAQGLANVKRGPDLEGPISLYLLAVAESGERKSECDRRFADPLRAWEAEQVELIKPDSAKSRADLAAWEAEKEAVLLNIKQARKAGDSTEEGRTQLAQLESERPEPIRVPRLLLESETAESLAWNLARPEGWPSGGILSSEAGIIFGGHAMRRDTIMQSLSLFNKLWSGEPHRVGRRTSEQFTLIGARLTMGLAVQPETVQAFFEESHGLARGTGFAARFLIAWPESTQGSRPYRDAPTGWPGLTLFQKRLGALLDERLKFNDRGELAPSALEMDPEAFEGWRAFHDGAERELRSGGELADVRDVASKAAENVARVAALFHLFEHGLIGSIGAAHVVAAARIVTWHLFEARRFLGVAALPKPLSNAAKLEAWLVAQCRERGADSVTLREVQRLGPNPVRRKSDLLAALAELTDASRARLEDDGRTIRINPALLGD